MKRFSILFGLALCQAFIATSAGKPLEKAFDDPQVLTRVKAALAGREVENVHLEICHGVVQLTGIVRTEPERLAAGRIVLDVEGVQDVRNHLLIRPDWLDARPSGEDRLVTSLIKASLGANEDIDSFDIHVEVHHGVVLLGGFVTSNGERKAAVRAARTTEGVREVISRIDVIRAT